MPRSTFLVQARSAGLLYLVIIVCGITSDLVLRAPLISAGNAAATAETILGHLGAFRGSMLLDLIMILSDVALAGLLYLLFLPISRSLALLMAAFRLVQSAILGANLIGQASALHILTTGSGWPGQQDMALVQMSMQAVGYDLGLAFFGVSCLLLALVVLRADGVQSWLGWLMAAAAPVYITGAVLRLVAPDWTIAFQPAYVVALAAELSFCLWLLTRGRLWPGALPRLA